MQPRTRVNAILLGLAALLALAVVLLPGPERGLPPPAAALDPAGIERIEIRFPRGGDTLRLQRQGDGWRLTEPVARAARSGRVARLLESLRERSGSCYPAADHDAAEFGLDPPRALLDLGGQRIALGDRAADGRRYQLAGGRLCLVSDVALPILRGGAETLAPTDAGD